MDGTIEMMMMMIRRIRKEDCDENEQEQVSWEGREKMGNGDQPETVPEPDPSDYQSKGTNKERPTITHTEPTRKLSLVMKQWKYLY